MDRIGVLAKDHVAKNGLKLGFSLVAPAPGTAGAHAEILEHRIDIADEAVGRHDRGRSMHTRTPPTMLIQPRVPADRPCQVQRVMR